MSKVRRTINIGEGSICRKCNKPTVIRKRTEKPRDKNFFYTQWEFCPRCNAVYFDEQFKSNDWKEDERQKSFLNDIRNN